MTTDQPLGTVLHDGERRGLRYVRTYPHPLDAVWRAVTESQHLRHWMPADLVGERRVGAPVELPFWPEHVERYGIEEPVLHGTIEAWDPPTRASWTWGGDVLLFELDETDDGTRLTFTTWLEIPDADAPGIVETGSGYHLCLDLLEDVLAGRPQPTGSIPDDVEKSMRARYVAAMGAEL
ncbi:SRPBCC domain-containing protein [Cellulomonas sp. S1-8]|uniref:SRPBCC domain-containing protein n=1 Tax=Cellulomonas sp. S1-8 TaxID=2904790 RepID=UPI002244A917|nr:SRPBCC domain-containing protein [Cellulomonas sp. S1-8]UZN01768.1 SRPBCC domain-containing protein [Cellulomonas sp. S1-8]